MFNCFLVVSGVLVNYVNCVLQVNQVNRVSQGGESNRLSTFPPGQPLVRISSWATSGSPSRSDIGWPAAARPHPGPRRRTASACRSSRTRAKLNHRVQLHYLHVASTEVSGYRHNINVLRDEIQAPVFFPNILIGKRCTEHTSE